MNYSKKLKEHVILILNILVVISFGLFFIGFLIATDVIQNRWFCTSFMKILPILTLFFTTVIVVVWSKYGTLDD